MTYDRYEDSMNHRQLVWSYDQFLNLRGGDFVANWLANALECSLPACVQSAEITTKKVNNGYSHAH